MRGKELQAHMFASYNALRMGMIAVAAAMPVAMVLWGKLFDVDWQSSLSAYYFAPAGNAPDKFSTYPGRVLFGGILIAEGLFLFLYRGFTRRENRALNLAGVCAIGVALFPMYGQNGYITFSQPLHYCFAVVLFAAMAYVAIRCADETLALINDTMRRARYRRVYRSLGWFMGLFPLLGLGAAGAIGLLGMQDADWALAAKARIFWIEAAGIEAFAAFWVVKSLELRETQAELAALRGEL